MIHQIYYTPQQKSGLDFSPYYNQNCTVYFENSVIVDLYDKDDDEYFGVLSPVYKQKIGTMRITQLKNVINTARQPISKNLILQALSKKPDILDLMRHEPHNTIEVANRFHPDFRKYFEHIMHEIGFPYKSKVYQNISYCNYQICKTDIYRQYVDEMLIPSMIVMDTMPELFNDSKYHKKLPSHLISTFGVKHYPYHSFICERLFTVWADSTNYNFYHL